MPDNVFIDMMPRPDEADATGFTPTGGVLGAEIRFVAETGSTNGDALAWAEAILSEDGSDERTAPHGHVVLADEQTGGRGRFGRTWQSEKGQNLLCSVILLEREVALPIDLLPLAAAVSAVSAIEEMFSELSAGLKWPNDLLSHGSKFGGILIESRRRVHENIAVVGFGINLNQSQFADEIEESATSVLLETGRRINRNEYFHRLMTHLEKHLYDPDHSAVERLRATYSDYLIGVGEAVRFQGSDTGPVHEGIFLGVDRHAAARIRIDGEERLFHAGEITFSVDTSEKI